MQGSTRQAIYLAYSMTLKHGRNYHARAYCESWGYPGLPENHSFKTAAGIANDSQSPDIARKAAVRALLQDHPELSQITVFDFGRMPDDLLGAAPFIGFRGRNWYNGLAGEYVK